jgi:pimeloyl-ACP methyl ester carboxylesterase
VPLAGFYAPPDRTLVLNVGDAAIVQGKYRRLILVSFTGFGNAPSFGSGSGCGVPVPAVCEGFGVAYPDNLLSCSSRGMTNITLEARGQAAPSPSLSTSVLAPGLASRAFTFYDSFNELSPCSTPSGPPDHATAEAWLRSLNPTSDDLIAVTGHSYGGNRARLFADQLRINQVRQNASVATDALIMVDPVDWTTCDGLTVLKSFTYLVSDPSCFQTGSPREIPQGVGAFRDFTQSKALTSGIPISGYPVTMGGIIQYQFITNFTDVGHANVPFIDDTIGIDNDPRVHLFILQALTGLVRGPTPTAAIAGTPSRGSSGLNYPIRVTATPVGTATGFGTVTGVRITSASLNGVPATSMLPSSALGDIVAGSSSSVVNLVFPVSAAAKGSSVLLTVAFENSDGAPYTNTIRQVAP